MQDIKRPQSVMSGRLDSAIGKVKEEGVKRSLSSEDRVWGHISNRQEEQARRGGLYYRGDQMRTSNKQEDQTIVTRRTFAATYYQNLLNKPKDQVREQMDLQKQEDITQDASKSTVKEETESDTRTK